MKCVEYNGYKFYRDDSNGYYGGWVNGVRKWLHRYVWEVEVGKIPEHCHIHHKDGNKGNNILSNLECMDRHDHLSMHSRLLPLEAKLEALKYAQQCAVAWHGSEDGKKWHKQHMEEQWNNVEYVEKICVVCGEPFSVDSFNVPRAKFCSNRCKSQYRRNSAIDNVTRVCVVCGSEFTTNKYSKSRTCSRSCAYKSRSL